MQLVYCKQLKTSTLSCKIRRAIQVAYKYSVSASGPFFHKKAEMTRPQFCIRDILCLSCLSPYLRSGRCGSRKKKHSKREQVAVCQLVSIAMRRLRSTVFFFQVDCEIAIRLEDGISVYLSWCASLVSWDLFDRSLPCPTLPFVRH